MPTAAIREVDSRRQYWQRNTGLWSLAALICLFSLIALTEVGYRRGFENMYLNAKAEAQSELILQSQILQSHLEKYRLLPVLMARHGIRNFEINTSKPPTINTWLQQLSYLTGSYDVLLLTEQGQILSSAQHNAAVFPPLAQTELVIAPNEARLGRGYINVNTDTQLYGFSSRLVVPNQANLIFVFFVDLAPVFESWSLSGANILAYDTENTVTLASDQSWIGQKSIADNFRNQPGFSPARLELKTMGWTIEAFIAVEEGALTQQVLLYGALLVLSIFIFFALFIRRRELQVKALLRDRLYAQELENQISIRTVELRGVNESLTTEIIERRKTELKLKTTQKELLHAAKLATIGQMSTTLSHEYNQPLAAMRTYAENSVRFIEKNRIEPVVDNLKRITAQIDRLGDLSKTLLSFARKPDDQLQAVNVEASVTEAVMLVQPRLGEPHIKIDVNIEDNLLLAGRKVQISQIILNLLTNAIDAILEHKLATTTDTEHTILITAYKTQHHGIITVEDSGPGIPVSKRESIFEPFNTSKSSGKGLGLGLSVIKDIVREHQGHILLSDSQLGGALIKIELPCWPEVGNE